MQVERIGRGHAFLRRRLGLRRSVEGWDSGGGALEEGPKGEWEGHNPPVGLPHRISNLKERKICRRTCCARSPHLVQEHSGRVKPSPFSCHVVSVKRNEKHVTCGHTFFARCPSCLYIQVLIEDGGGEALMMVSGGEEDKDDR